MNRWIACIAAMALALAGCESPDRLVVTDPQLRDIASRLVVAFATPAGPGKIACASATIVSDRTAVTCLHCIPPDWRYPPSLAGSPDLHPRIIAPIRVEQRGSVTLREVAIGTTQLPPTGDAATGDWALLQLTDAGPSFETLAGVPQFEWQPIAGETVYLAGFPGWNGEGSAGGCPVLQVFRGVVVAMPSPDRTFYVRLMDRSGRFPTLVSGDPHRFVGLSGGAAFILESGRPVIVGICQAGDLNQFAGTMRNVKARVLQPPVSDRDAGTPAADR
jgi:hypothetical protein